MRPLLGAVGEAHFLVIAIEGTKVVCVGSDGNLYRFGLEDVVIHGTAPCNWYTNECATTCEHPSRDYHCNHVSWPQMWKV